jgi:hypothetical protein
MAAQLTLAELTQHLEMVPVGGARDLARPHPAASDPK